jgi:hypothetical protein
MGRRLLGIVVFVALFGGASLIMLFAGVPIADYLPDIVGGLIASAFLVLAWTFKPEIDAMIRPRPLNHVDVEGKVGISASGQATPPKRDWLRILAIVRLATVGYVGTAVLTYIGFATYSIVPHPVSSSLFLAIITAIAGGISIAVATTFYLADILRS